MKAEFGLVYRDRITGFSGIATGRTEYISGCTQVLIAPRVDDNGAFRESQWFDEQRLELMPGANVIELDNGETPGADRPAPKR